MWHSLGWRKFPMLPKFPFFLWSMSPFPRWWLLIMPCKKPYLFLSDMTFHAMQEIQSNGPTYGNSVSYLCTCSIMLKRTCTHTYTTQWRYKTNKKMYLRYILYFRQLGIQLYIVIFQMFSPLSLLICEWNMKGRFSKVGS